MTRNTLLIKVILSTMEKKKKKQTKKREINEHDFTSTTYWEKKGRELLKKDHIKFLLYII